MYGFGFLITNSDITFTIYFWAEVFLVMLAPLKIVSFVLDTKLYSKKYRLLLLCNGSWFNFHTQRSWCVILTKVSKMRDFVRKKIKHFHQRFFKEIVKVQETQCETEKKHSDFTWSQFVRNVDSKTTILILVHLWPRKFAQILKNRKFRIFKIVKKDSFDNFK